MALLQRGASITASPPAAVQVMDSLPLHWLCCLPLRSCRQPETAALQAMPLTQQQRDSSMPATLALLLVGLLLGAAAEELAGFIACALAGLLAGLHDPGPGGRELDITENHGAELDAALLPALFLVAMREGLGEGKCGRQ